jgi:hypothetical protein
MARASYQHLNGIRIGGNKPVVLAKKASRKAPVLPATYTSTSFRIPPPPRATLTLKRP